MSDQKLRVEKNIVKHITNFVKDIFIHKLIKFNKKDKDFDNIIDEYNTKIYKYISKNYPDRYSL